MQFGLRNIYPLNIEELDNLTTQFPMKLKYALMDILGDIICLDNRRVLHGRTGFGNSPDATHDMSRHLEGIYLDWDEICSKRRVLQYDLGLDVHPPIY